MVEFPSGSRPSLGDVGPETGEGGPRASPSTLADGVPAVETEPRYRLTLGTLLRVALAVAFGAKRSPGAESERSLRGARPEPRAVGVEHLPAAGPYIVVGNHYQRPGLWTGWGNMVINVAVWRASGKRQEVHWLMVSELLAFRLGPWTVPRSLLRMAFARFVRVYGYGLVSARETGLVGGVAGLRTAARYLAAGQPVGVLPEGTASHELREARPGVGQALAWLSRDRIPLVPVGIAERQGILTAEFGYPFLLKPVEGSKEEREELLRDQVMVAIARLIPRETWGHYRTLVESGG